MAVLFLHADLTSYLKQTEGDASTLCLKQCTHTVNIFYVRKSPMTESEKKKIIWNSVTENLDCNL